MTNTDPISFKKPSAKKEKHSWGSSEVLASGPGFQIARLTVSALNRLPAQWHRHRDEQWVVVRGTATVSVDGQEQTLGRGQATKIPRALIHSAINISSVDPLEIIESPDG